MTCIFARSPLMISEDEFSLQRNSHNIRQAHNRMPSVSFTRSSQTMQSLLFSGPLCLPLSKKLKRLKRSSTDSKSTCNQTPLAELFPQSLIVYLFQSFQFPQSVPKLCGRIPFQPQFVFTLISRMLLSHYISSLYTISISLSVTINFINIITGLTAA